MTVGELVARLQAYHPDAEVRLQTQPNYPLEHAISGVTSRTAIEVAIGALDEQPEETDASEVVYLTEGRHIGYGSRDAWETDEGVIRPRR